MNDLLCDLVLNDQQLLVAKIKGALPENVPGLNINQLASDSEIIAIANEVADQQSINVQVGSEFRNLDDLIPVFLDGIRRSNSQGSNESQPGNDGIGEGIAEKVAAGIFPNILEGKDGKSTRLGDDFCRRHLFARSPVAEPRQRDGHNNHCEKAYANLFGV